jgi:hypothetical protein
MELTRQVDEHNFTLDASASGRQGSCRVQILRDAQDQAYLLLTQVALGRECRLPA